MIYRVITWHTSSRQPSGTFWTPDVLHVGTDKEAALVAYYGAEATDFSSGHGNPAKRTALEAIDPADVDIENIPEMEDITP